MDVDETFWTEKPVTNMPTSEKRVRQPSCPSTTVNEPHISPISSTPTLKNLLLRLVLTYTASSTLRAFRQWPHARAASLLRSSGGVPTAFLCLYFARSAAESHIGSFLFTESKNGWEYTLCRHGCRRLECDCNLDTPGIHAQTKWCVIKLFILQDPFKNAVEDGFQL